MVYDTDKDHCKEHSGICQKVKDLGLGMKITLGILLTLGISVVGFLWSAQVGIAAKLEIARAEIIVKISELDKNTSILGERLSVINDRIKRIEDKK